MDQAGLHHLLVRNTRARPKRWKVGRLDRAVCRFPIVSRWLHPVAHWTTEDYNLLGPDGLRPNFKPRRADFRSALYNWPAKIEHWPADSNGFFTGKAGTVHNTAVLSDTYLTLEYRPANAQFWSANCKVHSSPGSRLQVWDGEDDGKELIAPLGPEDPLAMTDIDA